MKPTLALSTPNQARLLWGFLHGWHAAAANEPCDPPAVFAAPDAQYGWRHGWLIACDQRARGVNITNTDEAVETGALFVDHALTPRKAMS